tara:strand:- start:285 stop:554 length:270 start_codon:yes stop_codon:yes gene_type:complete
METDLIEEVKESYPNGNPKVVGYYEKNGMFFQELRTKKYYSEKGQLEKVEEYQGYTPHGKWTYYGKDGEVSKEENYEDGSLVEQDGSTQ